MANRKDKKSKSRQSADPAAILQAVLRDAYQEAGADLQYYADKMKQNNETKRAIRQYLKELRRIKGTVIAAARELGLDLCNGGDAVGAQVAELIEKHAHAHDLDDGGYELCMPDRIPPEGVEGLDTLEDAIKQWEEELAQVGDDAQLANIDLQNALQKAQQTVQTMSNVSKLIHDTSTAIIRKIG